jgi:hypothetical protein
MSKKKSTNTNANTQPGEERFTATAKSVVVIKRPPQKKGKGVKNG